MRLKIFRIIVVVLFIIIAADLVYIQAIKGPFYYDLSKNNRIRVVPIEGRRGRILDRNDIVLAGNRVSFDVMVIEQEVEDKESLFEYLSQVLSVEKDKLLKNFKNEMLTPFAPALVSHDIPRNAAIILEENKFKFPGLIIRAGSQRYYPFKELNAHVLGYVGKVNRSRVSQLKEYGYIVPNMIGYSGVEEYYDSYLKGEDGGLQVEVNNRGQQVRMLGTREPISGQDLQLTLDNKIQEIAFNALGDNNGAVVIMDFETGEILSMVSKPSFDPNDFVSESGRKNVSSLFSDPSAPLLNRAIGGQYPPGSTFKIVVSMSALENDFIDTKTTFSCPGYYMLGRRRFRCSHPHGVQNITEAIAHSCNVFFYNVGLLIGPDLMSHYAADMFGLGRLTNIDLPYEAKGLVPSRAQKRKQKKVWYDGDTLNFSIGQGDVLVTPIQLTSMMATVANDGQKVQPHIVRAIGSGEIMDYPKSKESIFDKKSIEIVKAGLRAVVGDYAGTARILNIDGLPISGKTGTAQTSGGRASHAWFAGYCPSSKAKIAFCVFLEHGGSSYNACRVAKSILLKMQKEDLL